MAIVSVLCFSDVCESKVRSRTKQFADRQGVVASKTETGFMRLIIRFSLITAMNLTFDRETTYKEDSLLSVQIRTIALSRYKYHNLSTK